MNNNYSLKIITPEKKLEMVEREFYQLSNWFNKYDQLIWTFRSLLFSIYAAVIIYSLNTKTASNILFTLILFSIFFLSMEVYWLFRYWTKRTARYKNIQKCVKPEYSEHFKAITILDMDGKEIKSSLLQNIKDYWEKMIEPFMFYISLVIISSMIFWLS